jgi:hypothetical protein
MSLSFGTDAEPASPGFHACTDRLRSGRFPASNGTGQRAASRGENAVVTGKFIDGSCHDGLT